MASRDWCCWVLLLVCAPANAGPPRAQTEQGLVQGRQEAGLQVFRGLPYAAPPVGELRWREPMPPAPWAGVRDASRFGPACHQAAGPSLEGGGDPGPRSEDCLTLNVWTPGAAPGAARPVMVWIHGGALVQGAGHLPVYDGRALAGRDVVVVTINYRLGALGFFAHPSWRDGDAVNFGLLDQIAALTWVQANIRAFGGDPARVTVFGESAGGQSVLALYSSPLARGLFHRGIVQSAYGIPSHDLARARDASLAVARGVGQPGADIPALRAVPAERFFGIADATANLAPAFIVGDAALPEPILAAFQAGRQARLPLVIGSNSDEATVALAFGLEPAALVAKLRAGRVLVRALHPEAEDDATLGREVVRDVAFTAFAKRIAWLHSKSAPTWRYYFSHVPERLRGSQPGVAHGGEVPFVFGSGDACGCLGAAMTARDREVEREVGDYWVRFARGGDPNGADAPAWPRDQSRRPQVLEFSATPVVRRDFMRRRLDTYIGLLKAAGGVLSRQRAAAEE